MKPNSYSRDIVITKEDLISHGGTCYALELFEKEFGNTLNIKNDINFQLYCLKSRIWRQFYYWAFSVGLLELISMNGMDLQFFDFKESCLNMFDISDCNLSNSIFIESKLCGSDMSGAIVNGCIFKRVDFSLSIIKDVDFSLCNNLEECKFDKVTMSHKTKFPENFDMKRIIECRIV